jgi:[methyl-Co(III) methanol-specific corrinoid protein]:coenzyme M methyltransferase
MARIEMTYRERVLAVFNKQPYDKTPIISPTSVATVESMKIASAFFPHVHTNSDAMAALAATGHDLLGFDSVTPYFSIHQEAAALGCEINWGKKDRLPKIISSPLMHPDDFIFPANFLDRRPIKTVLQAIKNLRKKYGNKVAIIGKVIGPWTLAYHLHGTANLLLETILEPQTVRQYLETLVKVPISFAHAQFEAGADLLTWADHVTADLISSKLYEELLLPIHQQCNRNIQKSGPIILHVCGNVIDRLDLFCQTGFEAFHLDSRNDVHTALSIVANRMLLTGNINNPNTLLNGKPEDVRKAVEFALDAGIRLISPECALPLWIPNRNLIEIVQATRTKHCHVKEELV